MEIRSGKKAEITRSQIMNAFITLLKKKEYNRISVRELSETAGIQRSTFYRHFNDMNDLITCLEQELLCNMVFYEQPPVFDINHIEPVASIIDWFEWGMQHRTALIALMGPNGDPYFEKKLKKRVCADINRMMDFEGMPSDGLRPFCVELTYSIHFSLLCFAMQLGPDQCPFSCAELRDLSNHWRVCALNAERERKFPVSGKNKEDIRTRKADK